MEGKNMYNATVRKMVVEIFGTRSEVYKLMISGEKISELVKASIKAKGKGKVYRIKDKKTLVAECKKCEEFFNLKESDLGLN